MYFTASNGHVRLKYIECSLTSRFVSKFNLDEVVVFIPFRMHRKFTPVQALLTNLNFFLASTIAQIESL